MKINYAQIRVITTPKICYKTQNKRLAVLKKRHTFAYVTYYNHFYLKKLKPIENLIKKDHLRKSSFLHFIYQLNFIRL